MALWPSGRAIVELVVGNVVPKARLKPALAISPSAPAGGKVISGKNTTWQNNPVVSRFVWTEEYELKHC
jgi:hypothetical protein